MGVRRSFWAVAVALGIGCLFPVYLSVVGRARRVVDWDRAEGEEQNWKWNWRFVSRIRSVLRRNGETDVAN